MRALTFALTQPEARAVLATLGGALPTPPVVEALIEILARPHAAPLAPAALALLAESDHPLAVDALVQALDSPLVTVRQPAVESLARRGIHHAAPRLLQMLKEDDTWMVRRAALRALAGHPEPVRWCILAAADDPHWRVRHALIHVLLAWGENPEMREEIDRRLRAMGSNPSPESNPSPPAPLPEAERGEKEGASSPLRFGEGLGEGFCCHPRIEGVRGYLQARWTGRTDVAAWEAPIPDWPFHDYDPAVLVRKLDEMGEAGRRRYLSAMPALLAHEAERARSLAIEILRKRGETVHLVGAVGQLDDPRVGATEAVFKLLSSIDLDRIEEAARSILHKGDPSPAQLAWAIDQAGPVFPPEEERAVLQGYLQTFQSQPVRVRRALAQLLGRWRPEKGIGWGKAILADADAGVQVAILSLMATEGMPSSVAERLLASPFPEVREAVVRLLAAQACVFDLEHAARDHDSHVRIAAAAGLVQFAPNSPTFVALQSDPHPLVRAAALTPERAAELIAAPERETSWHVLAQAARMQKFPLWRLEPQPPWQPPASVVVAAEPLSLSPKEPPHPRTLGTRKLLAPLVGISGHYGLPVEGFVKAVEAGVNLLFWEPNYQTLTTFSARLSPEQRRKIHFLVGTFEANGPRIRKDVERALRNLRIERISLFMIFWTRSWDRITDEVRGTLERLEREGLIGMSGLSTHSRALAVEAIAAEWNPVMVRHSAAHRGAETQVFPHARQKGTSIITFNNTCYGRLLKPQGERPPPRAADCYRYTLSFPEVTMCLSAPATWEQLDENLEALRDPHLPEERKQLLLEQGAEVYREETLFRRLVRSR
jgi:HEAT repeat protein